METECVLGLFLNTDNADVGVDGCVHVIPNVPAPPPLPFSNLPIVSLFSPTLPLPLNSLFMVFSINCTEFIETHVTLL